MALGFCAIPWCGEALFGSGVLLRMFIGGGGEYLINILIPYVYSPSIGALGTSLELSPVPLERLRGYP